MVRHHEYEDIILGPADCAAHGSATVARTEAKLLILYGISGGRVLAQDGEPPGIGRSGLTGLRASR